MGALLAGESAAQGVAQAPYPAPARRAALQLYASCDTAVRVAEAQRRHRPSRPGVGPGLSVCILNLDKPELIVPLLSHLQKVEAQHFAAAGVAFECGWGDTGSTHPAVLDAYGRMPQKSVRQGLVYQFSACNNVLAYEHAQYTPCCF